MLAKKNPKKYPLKLFFVIAILGLVLRQWVSLQGYNCDLSGFAITAHLKLTGKNVYSEIAKFKSGYNYGPIWFHILAVIKFVQLKMGFNGMKSFHFMIATFLGVVDISLAIFAYLQSKKLISFIWLLVNPLSILLTGFHSQFDNLGIMFAAMSWVCLNRNSIISRKTLLISGILLGFSLMTKHIFIFFPLWFLWYEKMNIKYRVGYLLIAYGLFVFGFIPYSLQPEGRAGIILNVFQYNSFYGNGLFPRILSIVFPEKIFTLFNWVPVFSGIKFFWAFAMIGIGRMAMKYTRESVLFIYVLSLIVFTVAMADQYMAIPVLACAVFWKYWESYFYCLLGSLVFVANQGTLMPIRHSFINRLSELNIQWHHTQVILALLLTRIMWNGIKEVRDRLAIDSSTSRLRTIF